MNEEQLVGEWRGDLSAGTTSGRFWIRLWLDSLGHLEGGAWVEDFASGQVFFRVKKSGAELFLEPTLSHAPSTRWGAVRARIHAVDEQTFEGQWVSEVATWGAFTAKRIPPRAPEVFIVHGHDCEARAAVEEEVRRLGLVPIVLANEANEGQTIIEKLESQEAGYAIVLFTGDDQALDGDGLVARARQNVVFELGYFIGLRGRRNTLVLREPGVEMPSDVDGVVYQELDNEGLWKKRIALELERAGFRVEGGGA